jgi:hypothetical protein
MTLFTRPADTVVSTAVDCPSSQRLGDEENPQTPQKGERVLRVVLAAAGA